jgi:hypothetical protein
VLARGDRICANGRDDGRVGELRLSGDDAVCDEVVDALKNMSAQLQLPRHGGTHRVLLLLDFDSGTVLESPFDDISLVRSTLNEFTLLKRRPELAEVLKLDQVPNIAEGCLDDSRLADGGGSGDAARHDGCSCAIGLWRVFGSA